MNGVTVKTPVVLVHTIHTVNYGMYHHSNSACYYEHTHLSWDDISTRVMKPQTMI
jgi:outer membrane phospholipase A